MNEITEKEIRWKKKKLTLRKGMTVRTKDRSVFSASTDDDFRSIGVIVELLSTQFLVRVEGKQQFRFYDDIGNTWEPVDE